MWRKNTALFLFLTLTSILLFPSCATLIRSKMQGIPVTSSPVGATVIVNGAQQGVTPLEIRLARREGQVIRIESPGYNPVEIRLKRKLSIIAGLANIVVGAALGSVITNAYAENSESDDIGTALIVTPLIFAAPIMLFGSVDAISKKGFELKPKNLMITLTKADGTSRVDTLFVDAEEFQNIKWIRVRRD